MKGMKVWGLLILMAAVTAEKASADDSNLVCRIALSLLSPCKDFLVNVEEETIPETCCVGCLVLEKIVRNLKNRRKLKIGLCKCLQRDGSLSGADEDKAFQVIGTCNVTYSPILTGPDVDCTKEAMSDTESCTIASNALWFTEWQPEPRARKLETRNKWNIHGEKEEEQP
nr:non-specific lipid-transfer protein 1-like [Ipomoea batatas]